MRLLIVCYLFVICALSSGCYSDSRSRYDRYYVVHKDTSMNVFLDHSIIVEFDGLNLMDGKLKTKAGDLVKLAALNFDNLDGQDYASVAEFAKQYGRDSWDCILAVPIHVGMSESIWEEELELVFVKGNEMGTLQFESLNRRIIEKFPHAAKHLIKRILTNGFLRGPNVDTRTTVGWYLDPDSAKKRRMPAIRW